MQMVVPEFSLLSHNRDAKFLQYISIGTRVMTGHIYFAMQYFIPLGEKV